MGLYNDPFIVFPLSLLRAFPAYSNCVQAGYYSRFILRYIASNIGKWCLIFSKGMCPSVAQAVGKGKIFEVVQLL